MAHVAPIYTNFARGEVSPLMFGRIDIEQYPTCLDKCRNVYIRPYGCATRLTGTEFIANTKNNGKARLLKFVFSATDSYIIECGAGYFRFYQDGAAVLDGNNQVYEIQNSYSEEQLPSIQYVQLDDIIKLTCLPDSRGNSSAKPKELIRNSSNDWTFQDVVFKETPYLDQNTTDITMTPSAVTGDSITITSSEDYFNEDMVGANMWIGTKVTDTDTDKDIQGYVKITGFTDAKHVTASVESKLSGTAATKLWGEGAFSDYRGYPSVIALFDGRLWYARTPHQPRNVYGSKPYAYETFTPAVDNEDDAGINIALATNANGDGSDIRWMVGASYLLGGTYGGEFVIRSSGDGAITPTDISARQRTNWGGEPVQPIVAGTFIHFLQRNGNKLRQFQYDYYYDAYKAVDVSIFSEHLLASPIKEMALQKNPDSIIYLMREDGKVVMLTLEQDQSVQAWSLLEDMGAKVESIQTIPSYDGNYDEVYMVLKRQILETILTLASSNPAVIVTGNYSGETKPQGVETIILTYDGHARVWTNQDSTDFKTTLKVTSSNPTLIPTTSYHNVKTEVGTITEVVECTQAYYEINPDVLNTVGNPTFNANTGIASNFSNGYYTTDRFLSTPLGKLYNFEFTTPSQSEYDYGGLLKLHCHDGDINVTYIGRELRWGIVDRQGTSYGDSVSVNANTTYNLRIQIEEESYIFPPDYLERKKDRFNFALLQGGSLVKSLGVYETSTNGYLQFSSIGVAEHNGYTLPFKGTINLLKSDIGDSTIIENETEWTSQTTGELVDISTGDYMTTLNKLPTVGDTLTYNWVTVSNYVNPSDYNISISGTPADGDTITLTYTTDYTTTARYIERMMNPITEENPNNWWYLRSGLKYDGFKQTEGNTLTLSANSGEVTATASSAIFSSSMVGNRIRFIDDDYNVLGEGEITEYISSTVVTLNITTYFQSSVISGGKWGISTDTVSGLNHLEGQTVNIYADTKEQESKTVSSGAIDIEDAFIVIAGLPYQSYITTMPMEAGSQNGTAVGKRKRISEMAIRVWHSIGVRAGKDLNSLHDTIYQQQKPFTGVIPNIKYNQGWVWDANITVEQSHPYPMNILSIAPIVTEVDK